MMNETRKLVTKLKDQREDLGKKDGKTKDRVEGWRKNVGALTGQLKSQIRNLNELGDGEAQGDGRGDTRRDYFTMIVSRLQKDIEDQVKICSRVTTLSLKTIEKTKGQHD